VPLKRKTAQEKEHARLERDRQREADRIRKQREAFYATPQGQARLAFERGDHVFQYEIDVMNQKAVIVAMVGSTATHKTVDPTWVLNSVCHEGWELVTGSFVFVEQGHQSRDKFMSSGQNIAVKGRVVGYYLFRRCPANRSVDGSSTVPSDTTFDIPIETPDVLSIDFSRGLFEEGDFAGKNR
jgi:hypothetical protein